ncbi:hypothetical protein [Streptomyces echinatus]|uniref:Secreted protein n=1 Tax=Streptomyces echinatus TaxID=67293 RepID=A0A7W9PR25_9ACTN|nr:hypothetical protein [Streptomyces echinatus]MBB5926226.1 hypothetical protein [Streptomyces echinatus]
MVKAILRGAVLAATATAGLMAGAWGASASEGTVAPGANLTLRCYATVKNPEAPVCYRLSAKAEYRHGQIVYVPILIQVPTPAQPPAVIIVNSLNDIHPNTGS